MSSKLQKEKSPQGASTGPSANTYDHLLKLLVIGDSGKKLRIVNCLAYPIWQVSERAVYCCDSVMILLRLHSLVRLELISR